MATLFNTKIKDTYQSLLKLEDNTILTTTSKNITDGLGNASPLYLSTTRVGIGTNAPTKNFEVSGTARINDEFSLTNSGVNARFMQVRRASGWLCFGNTAGAESIAMNGSTLLLGTTPDSQTSSRLQITGAGSTSATTSLLVQNSGGNAALTVKDDLSATIGGGLTLSSGITILNAGAPNTIDLRGYTATMRLNTSSSSGYFDLYKGFGYSQISSINEPIRYGAPSHLFGGTTNVTSALVNIESTTQGFLAPRMTTVQRDAIASPATGLQVFNTTLGTLDIYDGTGWDRFGSQTLIRGAGTTSATTSLLVQDNSGNSAFQITDDRVVSVIGGSTLKITSPLSSGAPIILSNNGATGGYRGGYDFKSGYNGSEGNTAFRITSPTTTSSFVGIGNLTDSDVAGGTGKLQIENTLSTGRNAAIKLRVNFADIINQYNGIQFDTIESGSGGAFMGSQRNTAGSGYGSDLVILTTTETPANTYTETARFVGKSQSLSIGAGKTPTARLQVQGSGSTNATTSLLVQNSSGTTNLSVDDAGNAVIKNQLDVLGGGASFRVTSSATVITLGLGATGWMAYTAADTYFLGNDFYANSSGKNLRWGGGAIFGSAGNRNNSSIVQIESTTQGFLPPRMTTAQKNLISSPATGLMVFDTDLVRPCFFNGATWITL